MIPFFCASHKHFTAFAEIVAQIEEKAKKGGEEYIECIKKYHENSENIEDCVSWISGEFEKSVLLAKECCNFILTSKPFLVNFSPSKKLEWLKIARQASCLVQDDSLSGKIDLEIGSAYWFSGNYRKAIIIALKISKLFEGSDNACILAEAYGLIGLSQLDLGEYEKAREYLGKAISRIDDEKRKAVYLPVMGRCFEYLGEYEKAKDYYIKSLLIAHRSKDLRNIADIVGNLGILFSELGKEEKSKRLLMYALKVARRIKDTRGMSNQLISLSSVYMKIGKVNKAIRYAKQAFKICYSDQNAKGKIKCDLILFRCSILQLKIGSAAYYAYQIYRISAYSEDRPNIKHTYFLAKRYLFVNKRWRIGRKRKKHNGFFDS